MNARPPIRLVAIAVIVFATAAPILSHAAERQGDRDAIKLVIAKRTEAFNLKNAAGQAALYTQDAGFFASNGVNAVKGREKIEGLLRRVHQSVLKDASLNQVVTSIEFLAPDIAVAMVDLTMTRPERSGGTYKNRGLRIMRKVDGTWKIHTFINQRVISEQELNDK